MSTAVSNCSQIRFKSSKTTLRKPTSLQFLQSNINSTNGSRIFFPEQSVRDICDNVPRDAEKLPGSGARSPASHKLRRDVIDEQ
jgi:hypothetical protein